MLIAAWKVISETIPLAEKQSETISRVERDRHPANDHEDEKKNDDQTEAQAQLLAHDREDEVRVGVGQVGHFCRPLPRPRPSIPPLPQAISACICCRPAVMLVLLRMEKGQDTAVAFRNMGREVKNGADSA